MATLPLAPCLKSAKKHLGLTLIEVLVALAIVAIAMTAVIKTVSENIRSTAYLEDKTSALYVAQQVMNEARVGVLQLPDNDKLQEKTDMLGKTWYWQATESATPNPSIRKIVVNVYSKEPQEDEQAAIVSLQSYHYKVSNG